MSLTEPIVARYLSLTERSQFTRTLVYSLTAFVVVFAIDLLWHFAGWNWFWERLACNAVEAAILGVIAAHVSRLREELILRRQQEVRYLNHHIRNALTSIQFAAQQLDDIEQRANVVRRASNRICSVLEQLSRNEKVCIDKVMPENHGKDAAIEARLSDNAR